MDTVEFLNEGTRMCNNYEACVGCPMEETDDCCMANMNLKQMISIVEQWAKEHPVKTRQSELLKLFPEAEMIDDSYINICPVRISKEYKNNEGICRMVGINCDKCKRDFWLTEIKDGEA